VLQIRARTDVNLDCKKISGKIKNRIQKFFLEEEPVSICNQKYLQKMDYILQTSNN
jgi:hypothetical protein